MNTTLNLMSVSVYSSSASIARPQSVVHLHHKTVQMVVTSLVPHHVGTQHCPDPLQPGSRSASNIGMER